MKYKKKARSTVYRVTFDIEIEGHDDDKVLVEEMVTAVIDEAGLTSEGTSCGLKVLDHTGYTATLLERRTEVVEEKP